MIQDGQDAVELLDNAMSDDALLKALENTRMLIARFEAQRTEATKHIERLRQEANLFERLFQLRRGGSIENGHQESIAGTDPSEEQLTQPGVVAVAEVIKELTYANRPLHISELMRVLRERNIPIPGAGLQANLIIHLSRDSRLVRTSRGMYALAAWGINNITPNQSRQSKKRFRVTAQNRKD